MHVTCINVKQKGVQPIDERTNYFSDNYQNNYQIDNALHSVCFIYLEFFAWTIFNALDLTDDLNLDVRYILT